MAIITKYFPEQTGGLACGETVADTFAHLAELYTEWNARINLVSRKDIDNLLERHILHSLSIAKFLRFTAGTRVMDAGTGGGFPGIPLAVMFPDVHFHLVDSTGKKIAAAQAIADAVGLQNVTTRHCRLEEEKGQFDFVVSRAVMTLPELSKLVRKNILPKPQRNALPNGLICLKGGDLAKETARFGKNCISVDLSDYFEEEFFKTKKIVYLPL